MAGSGDYRQLTLVIMKLLRCIPVKFLVQLDNVGVRSIPFVLCSGQYSADHRQKRTNPRRSILLD